MIYYSIQYASGRTIVLWARTTVGALWNGAATETLDGTNAAGGNYDIALTESSEVSGVYEASFAIDDGEWIVTPMERLGVAGSYTYRDIGDSATLFVVDDTEVTEFQMSTVQQAIADAGKLAPSEGDPADGSVMADLDTILAVSQKSDTTLEADGDNYRFTADALANGSASLDAADVRAAIGMAAADLDEQLGALPTAAAIAAAVWAILTSTLTTAGSIGKWLLDTIGAVKAKTDLITASSVEIVSSVTTAADILTLVAGDDYTVDRGAAVTITPATMPSRTGATVYLEITDLESDAVVFSVAEATADASDWIFEPEAADTIRLIRTNYGRYQYAVVYQYAAPADRVTKTIGGVVVR